MPFKINIIPFPLAVTAREPMASTSADVCHVSTSGGIEAARETLCRNKPSRAAQYRGVVYGGAARVR